MHKRTQASFQRVRPRSDKPAKEALLANYQKTVLPGGVRVVTEAIPHVRSVALGVWLNVGSRDERADRSGISHFVEHMVFKGTKHYRANQIAQSLESVGGFLNAFTSKEHTCFYARVLDEHLEKAIDVLADLVQYPVFDAKELEKEKQVVLEELKNIDDDPDDLIHDYFDRMIFGEHPLGFPVIGKAETITAFHRGMLLEHLHRHYLPSVTVIAAAGNVSHDVLVKLAERYFRNHLSGRRNGSARPKASSKKIAPMFEKYEKPISQAHICLGMIGHSVRSRYRYPLLVLNTLLGEGMSSRLFQNIREKYGFAYNIFSFANMLSDTGTFGVYAATDAANVEHSIELIYKELEKLRTKLVSKAELQRTKEQLKGTMMLSLESMSSRMMRLGSGELVFGEYIPLDSILFNIDAVTQEAVHGLATKLFVPSNFSTVIFKPVGKPHERSLSVPPESSS